MRMARRMTGIGTPRCVPSMSEFRKFPQSPMPAEFIPLRASMPASTNVRNPGPRSGVTRRTMAASRQAGRQSQFWPQYT